MAKPPGMRSLADRQREQERADADDRELTSRSDRRRARLDAETELKQLAKQLVALKAGRLQALQLPEPVLDAVMDAQRIASTAARERQIRVVRQRLREAEPAAIAGRLESLLRPDRFQSRERAALAGPTESWCDRLLREGDAALSELLATRPEGDRSHLRQLLRAARAQASQAALAGVSPQLRRLRAAVDQLVRPPPADDA